MSRKQQGASKLLCAGNSLEKNLWLALAGAHVDTERKEAVYRLVALTLMRQEKPRSYLQTLPGCVSNNRKQSLANKLTKILIEPLLKGEAEPFAEFAVAISDLKRFPKPKHPYPFMQYSWHRILRIKGEWKNPIFARGRAEPL